MNAEQHNQLHGQPLAVQVMDLVRDWPERPAECTLWTVVKHLAERYKLNATARAKLYHRVNTQVRTLEAAGMLVTEKKWIPSKQVFTKLIRPC